MDAEALITPLYAALCGLLLLALSIRVITLRRRKKLPLHHGEDEQLMRAIRAQGNFAEYVPLSLLLLLLIELNGAPRPLIWALGTALIASRLLHLFGITVWERRISQNPYGCRAAGMVLTFTVLAITSAYAIYQFYFGYHF